MTWGEAPPDWPILEDLEQLQEYGTSGHLCWRMPYNPLVTFNAKPVCHCQDHSRQAMYSSSDPVFLKQDRMVVLLSFGGIIAICISMRQRYLDTTSVLLRSEMPLACNHVGCAGCPDGCYIVGLGSPFEHVLLILGQHFQISWRHIAALCVSEPGSTWPW